MMKNLNYLLTLLIAVMIITGCSRDDSTVTNNYYIDTVEVVEVQLQMKSVFNVESNGFRSSYVHEYPISYKAYFITLETKGDYREGDLVTSIDVTPGLQTITVPKLKYKVYVTNYEKSDVWYTWSDAIEQLPMTSNELYLFGSNEINYSTSLYGEVEVKNPYAAVMIEGSSRITEAPIQYDTNTNYVITEDGWWLKYIRRNKVNTGVKIKFTTETKSVTINDPIEANKVYWYTLNAEIPNTGTDDNFNVIVEEFDEVIDREIEIW